MSIKWTVDMAVHMKTVSSRSKHKAKVMRSKNALTGKSNLFPQKVIVELNIIS